MTQFSELLPCPFCGEQLAIRPQFYDRDYREQPPVNVAWHSGFVASDSPCIFSGKGFYESEWGKWNTRAAHAVISAKIEELTDLPRVIELQRTAAPDCEREDGWNAGLDRAADVARAALAPHPEGTDHG